MIELAVAGATGRMGQCVLELAGHDDRFKIVAALTETGDPLSGSTMHLGDTDVTVVEKLGIPCDVLIDFTVAAGTIAWLDVCERFEIPMVIGATGHDEPQWARIRKAARIMPIVKAVNFSVGIQALRGLVGRLAQELGEDYDIELLEAHHRHKIDAPSGTAHVLLDEILQATERTRDDHVVYGRHGDVGERPAGQIGVHALRMGGLVGRHEIHFSGPSETVTITHAVQSRETFAAGALRAAAWVVNQDPGLYSLGDVIS